MSLIDAVDEILGLAQQIQGFVQTLLQADGFMDEQWTDVQSLERAIKLLGNILTELQADVQILPASQIISGLAMDCRTPLNALIGYSHLFMAGVNGTISDHLRSIFQHIYELGTTILRIINDLLDEARANQVGL